MKTSVAWKRSEPAPYLDLPTCCLKAPTIGASRTLSLWVHPALRVRQDQWLIIPMKVFDSFPMLAYPYSTSLSWSHSLNSLRHARNVDEQAYQPPTVVLVKGPKRSGKSTLARAALNTLLERYERVAWLECDLGQGEFTCGGAVGVWVLDSPVLGEAIITHYLTVTELTTV